MSPLPGFFLLQILNRSLFSLSASVSLSVSLSLSVSENEVGRPQPTTDARYERNQAGPEKSKVALDLGSLRLLWQIRKGALPPEEFTYCVRFLNMCL